MRGTLAKTKQTSKIPRPSFKCQNPQWNSNPTTDVKQRRTIGQWTSRFWEALDCEALACVSLSATEFACLLAVVFAGLWVVELTTSWVVELTTTSWAVELFGSAGVWLELEFWWEPRKDCEGDSPRQFPMSVIVRFAFRAPGKNAFKDKATVFSKRSWAKTFDRWNYVVVVF